MALSLSKFAKATPPKAKKETSPVIDLPPNEVTKKALQTIIEQKKIEKSAENIRKQAETILRPVCDELRRENIVSTGKFVASINIKADDVGPVRYSNQNRYSDMGLDKKEELEKIFEEDYDRSFSLKTVVKLTDKGLKAAEDESENGLLAKLVAACGGEEKFIELFEITQTVEPTNWLHEQKISDQKITEKVKKANELGLVKQASSSFAL